MLEIYISVVFFISLSFFLWYSHRGNELWSATVTPLASIIGSGFLVVAPLLHAIGGSLAVPYMFLIIVVAYAIGYAVRFNIKYEEDTTSNETVAQLERFSNLVLSFAYIISVAFYLRLLSSFLMSGIGYRNEAIENLLTSLVLGWIGLSGYLKGLKQLEWLEKYSVSVKLAVILSLLVGLLLHDITSKGFPLESKEVSFETFRYLAGILLIVQGFETSKYLKGAYSREIRIKSMKVAQLLSGAIYIGFILLILPVLGGSTYGVDETEIIRVSREISLLLPYMLVFGAVMSQFSASVADTIGSGGLLQVETRGRVSARTGYLMTAVLGIILVWSANIFEIISYASRAFAFYYLLQTLIAMLLARRYDRRGLFIFLLMIPVLAFVVIFGEPVEGNG